LFSRVSPCSLLADLSADAASEDRIAIFAGCASILSRFAGNILRRAAVDGARSASDKECVAP
jgi:hypothetical protein